VDNLAFIPAMSVSMAASAMVAQCLGAGKGERVDATMRAAVLLASGFCAVLLVVLNLFPLAIARVFTDDAGVLSHTEGYFRIMSVNYWIFSIFFIYMGAIRGSGEMLRPLLIIGGVMASRVVLSWFLSGIPALHEVGIWLAILITTIFGLVAMVWYFRAGKWRERVVVHGDGKGLVGGTVEVGL
jgi:Na+-driven multidrug efflux pump